MLGQPVGGGGAVVLMLTVSKATVLKAPGLCEVTASPSKIEPLIFSVALDPGDARN